MDIGKAALVVAITLLLVVMVNVAIFIVFTRRRPSKSVGQIELLQRAAHRARAPWQEEDQNLEELSRRVAELKEKNPPQTGE